MPVFPGTPEAGVRLLAGIADQGFVERELRLTTHTGTHVDAPAHLLEKGSTLDTMDLTRFVGRGCVVDVRGAPGGEVRVEALAGRRDDIVRSDFVLLRTGRAEFWDAGTYFETGPALSTGAVDWLRELDVSGVGLDAASPDPVDSTQFPAHRALLESGMVVIENLTNLEALPPTSFLFLCLPLPIRDGDGSPVRAVAVID